MRLTQFVNPTYGYTYTFPPQTEGTPVFGGRSPATVTIPGGWGGIDLDGQEGARRNIANYRCGFWLHADNSADYLEAQKSDVLKMANLGVGRLFSQPVGGGYPVRWVWAKINNVAFDPETPDRVPHRRQRVTLDFQIVSPRWYSRADATYAAATGIPSTNGVRHTGTYNNGDTFELTNNGDEFAPATVTVTATAGGGWYLGQGFYLGQPGLALGGQHESVSTFGIRRLAYDDTTQIDGWDYAGGVDADGRVLTVRSDDKSVAASWTSTLSDYISNFTPYRAEYLQIAPGTHTYKIVCGAADVAAVTVDYWDAWSGG